MRPGLPELGPHVITGRLLWISGDARTKRFQATRQLAATAIQRRFVRGRRLEANEILNQAFDPVAVSSAAARRDCIGWTARTSGYNETMIFRIATTVASLAILSVVVTGSGRANQAAPPASQRPQPPRPATNVPPLFPEEAAPSESVLGVTVYAGAVFLTSYEAGKGQRFYLYGSNAGFTESWPTTAPC